jgi:hypothetical protein
MSAPTAARLGPYRPSEPLRSWRTEGRVAMNHLLAARRAVGGSSRSRREAAQQVDHAMTVQYAALFQRFCRELHSECVRILAAQVRPGIDGMLRNALLDGRRLQRHNAHPGAIGDDFDRLDVRLWTELYSLDPRYAAHRRRLEELNAWRNAIAHQDFSRIGTDQLTIGIRPDRATLRAWRHALDQLAGGMDRVMYAKLSRSTGGRPW